MGKIDLGRERGVRITGSAQHGATSPRGYESAMQGVSRMNAAADNVARGMRHVSDTLFKVYEDQAQTRNRQEFLEGQTQQFDITQQENKLLESRIEKGEFDGVDGLDLFEKAVVEANNKIDNAFSEWASKNITREDTRNALIENSKLDSKKNFAYLSGKFIAHDRKRRWDMCQNQMSDAVKSGNYQNGITAIDAYCTNKSPELKKEMLQKFGNEFEVYQLNLRLEQGESIINPDKQKEYYESVVDDLQGGKYKGLYKTQIEKVVAKIQKGIDKAEYKDELRTCSQMLAKDISNMSEKQFIEWEKSSLSDIENTKHLSSKEKELWKVRISNKRKLLQEKFLNNTRDRMRYVSESLLDKAVNDAHGNVDLSADVITGTSRKNLRDKIDSEQNSYFADGTIAVQYDKNFHDVMSDISNYKNSDDKDGIILKAILFRTQEFTREHRKMLINAINNKVKGVKPKDWSDVNIRSFEAQIDSMIVWYDVDDDAKDEKKQQIENPKSIAFYQMRESIIDDVKQLGLTPLQAMDYLQKHPIYRRLKDKQAYADAVDFLNGISVKGFETKNEERKTKNTSFEDNKNREWPGRRYYGM